MITEELRARIITDMREIGQRNADKTPDRQLREATQAGASAWVVATTEADPNWQMPGWHSAHDTQAEAEAALQTLAADGWDGLVVRRATVSLATLHPDLYAWPGEGHLTNSQYELLVAAVAAELTQPGSYSRRWWVGWVGMGGPWGDEVMTSLGRAEARETSLAEAAGVVAELYSECAAAWRREWQKGLERTLRNWHEQRHAQQSAT